MQRLAIGGPASFVLPPLMLQLPQRRDKPAALLRVHPVPLTVSSFILDHDDFSESWNSGIGCGGRRGSLKSQNGKAPVGRKGFALVRLPPEKES